MSISTLDPLRISGLSDVDVAVDGDSANVDDAPAFLVQYADIVVIEDGRLRNSTKLQAVWYFDMNTSAIECVFYVFYIGTFLFGLTGNSLVLYVVTRFAKIRLKSVANYYIWNLAFADLLYVLGLPLFCLATYLDTWPLGAGLVGAASCKISYIARDANKLASAYTLAALSVDRYLASWPERSRWRTIRFGKTICVGVWTVSILFASPYGIYANARQFTANRTTCLIDWQPTDTVGGNRSLKVTDSQSVLLSVSALVHFQAIVGLVLPSGVVTGAYVMLYRRLRALARISTVEGHHQPNASVMSSKTNRRSPPMTMTTDAGRMTRTALVVVVTFIVCQIPYHVLQLVYLYRNSIPRLDEGPQFIYASMCVNAIAQILVFVSSCCSPILYGILNKNFRK